MLKQIDAIDVIETDALINTNCTELNFLLKSEMEYRTIIARSPVIKEKLEIIERVAKTDSSVLILGESGVGKEIFAEQIHLKSNRCKKPFVRVNCAAIPEGLLGTELFGYADGGTVFFDEMGELAPALQSKLLRVIQERVFEKNGSGVDVRILAATNRDMEKQVEKGEFGGDLFYRRNVLPLYIPPLRQRPQDIPGLAELFLKNSIKKTKNSFEGFSEEAMETILSYSWPGNIRELENCVEHACITGKGSCIEAGDLFPDLPASASVPRDGNRDLKKAENIFRAQFIKKVLTENNWNQTETSKALNIQRTYLSRLIKELEINNPKEQ
jgi:Nif-specific regulatory protein